MYEIKTLNSIAQQGLDQLAENGLVLDVNSENPDGLLVRSAKLHDWEFGDRLAAIARAGVGTDNVPVARCTESGIAVFNSAGANAEAVKELAICALLLASRDIVGGIRWAEGLHSDNVAAEVEKGRAPSSARRSTARPWASSAWAPSARWWPTPPRTWA